jgi:DNA-directed RNA polymerase subunit beta'
LIDQMAVHLPLGPEAILEAQLLMLVNTSWTRKWCANYCTFSGHGFDYIIWPKSVCQLEKKILGQDLTFYSAEEVNIALNEGRLELNARELEQRF